MRKEIKLQNDGCDWGTGSWSSIRMNRIDYLCMDTLANLFDIPEDQKKIIGVLSDKKMAQSYLIELDGSGMYIDGEFVATYRSFDELVERYFNGKCYGRIEYEV